MLGEVVWRDRWLGEPQAELVIRRLTTLHPERNGREAETWAHPSKLAGPARLHSGMKRSKGQLWVGEVWSS